MSTAATTRRSDDATVRRALREGDVQAIADLHRRVYGPEYGRNEDFVASVRRGVEEARRGGWPQRSGAVWLVERCGRLVGSLALTDEGGGVGRVRWFVLEADVRGHGLGRSLVAELLDEARCSGMRRLVLETFSALTAAARIYRDAGFELRWSRERDDWGPPVTYQGYDLELR
ncbi:MAG: GNAT family N-acetyltransferase [Solirubrobacterales bacterium]|nr:GNAT family N-acetyltransferase [Solirubrobacterales bacterium]